MQKSLGVLIFIVLFQHGSCILTKMACRTSGKGTCTDPFCFVTPVNDKVNAANFGCGNITRPMYKVNIRQQFYFKFFQSYIPFNIFPEVEWCSFVAKPNPYSYFNGIVNALKEKVPGFVKQCPYSGTDVQIKNLILGTSDLALWITGEYKLIYTLYDDIDPKILEVSARGIIKRN